MAYLPEGMPKPQPSRDDAPFWAGCAQRTLVLRHCDACERSFHPPMPSCPRCAATRLSWKPVSGEGVVYTFTVSHHPTYPALKGRGAYNVAVILLDDADDVRLVSNVVDIAPEDLRIGLPVSVHWDDIGEGMYLPRFQKRAPQARAEGAAS